MFMQVRRRLARSDRVDREKPVFLFNDLAAHIGESLPLNGEDVGLMAAKNVLLV